MFGAHHTKFCGPGDPEHGIFTSFGVTGFVKVAVFVSYAFSSESLIRISFTLTKPNVSRLPITWNFMRVAHHEM
jgi:hypothetical protein